MQRNYFYRKLRKDSDAPRIDIPHLVKPHQKKSERRLHVYRKILQKCHSRIQTNADNGALHCWYVVPDFVFGLPLFNVAECTHYLLAALRDNGFETMLMPPKTIFIDWARHTNAKPNRYLTTTSSSGKVTATKEPKGVHTPHLDIIIPRKGDMKMNRPPPRPPAFSSAPKYAVRDNFI